MKTPAITAVGHYAPDKILTNAYFESYLDTSDEWIVTRTGIRERHVVENQATSDLAVEAARRTLAMRGIGADQVDLIIVATVTPDMFFPSTAALVQNRIGASRAWGFDLSGACSGFLYALATGAQFIIAGTYSKVLVIGADTMSSITDYRDRNNCILFGDGGAAVLLEPGDEPGYGYLDWVNYMDGCGEETLHMKAGGSRHPATHETVDKGWHYIYQDGKSVFKVAVIGMAEAAVEIMRRNNLSSDDVAWLVPHQANLRIIQATADRMGIGMDKVMINIDRYGNTTAATIPSCLAEYYADGRLKRGDNIVLAAFGAGYTWGAAYVRWSI
ncbi:MAG: beta-ketoacyl-ACP synthase III [Bacteroidota bacterium]|nr:beta-ketoacyl-ACP synthase III [Bacteroidota bacterium]